MRDGEARAVGLPRETCLVEQRLGLGRVERIERHVGRIGVDQLLRHRPGRGRGKAEPDILDHEFTVDGVGDGLAHPDVLELRVAHVELEIEHGAQHREAVGRHGEAGQLGQPDQVGEAHREATADIDLAGLEGDDPGAGIGNEAGDQPIDLRLALLPIIGVALHLEIGAALPRLELERAGADRRIDVANLGRIGDGVEMLGQHRRFAGGERGHDVGRRAGELEDRGEIVRGLDRLEVGERGASARMILLQDLLEGEFHVGRGEGFAVVELHALSQGEGDRLAIGRERPGGGQRRMRRELVVVGDQAVHHLGRDLLDDRRGAEGRVQARRLGADRPGERARALRARRPGSEQRAGNADGAGG